MHWKAVGKPTKKPRGMSVRLGRKQTHNPTIDRDQSSCRLARELLLAGSIRRENHQTMTVPGASTSLADFYGNPLDDIDPVSAPVSDLFTIEWLCLSGCVRRPDTQLILAGARLPPNAPRCSAVASDRDSVVPGPPPSALNSTLSIGPKPDQARPSMVILPASTCRLRDRKSGIPGGIMRACGCFRVTGVPGSSSDSAGSYT